MAPLAAAPPAHADILDMIIDPVIDNLANAGAGLSDVAGAGFSAADFAALSDPLAGLSGTLADPMAGASAALFDPMAGVSAALADPLAGVGSALADPLTGLA